MQPTSNPPRRGAGLPIAIVAASSLVAAAVIAVAVLVRQAPDTANQDVLVPAATAMATQPPATAPIAVQPQAALPLVQPGPSIAAVEQPAIEEPKEATAVAATTRHAKWRRKDSPSADRDGTAPEADSEEADEAVGAKAGGPVDLEDALATSTETSKPEAEEPSSTASMDDLMTGNAPASSAAAAPAVKEPAKDRSIDELLDVAVSESNGSKAPAASAKAAGSAPSSASLPMQPTRDQVMVAMRGVTPSIQRCASQYGAVGGVAKVKFSIQGLNGTVSAADVSGVGGSAAACIANAAKSAKFSPFQKPMFSVNFPFSL